jgi:tetratricopeptide (TPR) repeat protein
VLIRQLPSLVERAQSIEDKLADCFTGEDAARIRAKTLTLAGAIRRTQGDYARAECDLLKALEISGAEFGEASEETAQARNGLGVLYKYWGRFDDGMRLYRRALASMIALHGDESLACAGVYHNIGGILHTQGAHAAAEEPGRRAWEISRRLLGEDDPRTMRDAVAYAAILDGLGKHEESEPIYRKALLVFEKAFGSEHYEVAMTLQNFAGVLAARGAAEPLYRRALMMQERMLGNSHPEVALLRNNLGRLLTDTGRSGKAVPLLENAVSILESRLLPGHPHLSRACENLRNARVLQNS